MVLKRKERWYNYKLTYTGRWNYSTDEHEYSYIARARNRVEAKEALYNRIDTRVIITNVQIAWRVKA